MNNTIRRRDAIHLLQRSLELKNIFIHQENPVATKTNSIKWNIYTNETHQLTTMWTEYTLNDYKFLDYADIPK